VVGPDSRSGLCTQDTNLLLLRRIDLRFLGHLAHGLVTIPSELPCYMHFSSTNHYVNKSFFHPTITINKQTRNNAGASGSPLTPVQNPQSQFYFLSQTESRWILGGGGVRETTVFHITAPLCTSATDRSDDTSPNKSLSIPVVSYRGSSIPITCYDRHR
jgi:hypothetical protein